MMTILFEIKENIGFITLNRPEKFNAFNREMALLLQEKLDQCMDENIRCVCITGMGKAFCAGQDITELVGESKIEMKQILSEHYNPIVDQIRKLAKPVIAMVNGVAAGAGANIALACDIVLAIDTAAFIQAFSKIGLIPDSGGTYTLPRLIGWQKASALMMLGEKIMAADAEKLGMIYKSYAVDIFEQECLKIATTLAQMPTQGLALTKFALQKSFENNWQQQLLLEDAYQQKAAATKDYNEGIHSFLEKRTPTFSGK